MLLHEISPEADGEEGKDDSFGRDVQLMTAKMAAVGDPGRDVAVATFRSYSRARDFAVNSGVDPQPSSPLHGRRRSTHSG
jgi:hypothetical protein